MRDTVYRECANVRVQEPKRLKSRVKGQGERKNQGKCGW
jgi:hypothetical protein